MAAAAGGGGGGACFSLRCLKSARRAKRAKRVFVRSARMLQPAGADVGTRRVAEVFLVATELDEQRREGMDEHRRFISTVIFAFHWD